MAAEDELPATARFRHAWIHSEILPATPPYVHYEGSRQLPKLPMGFPSLFRGHIIWAARSLCARILMNFYLPGGILHNDKNWIGMSSARRADLGADTQLTTGHRAG